MDPVAGEMLPNLHDGRSVGAHMKRLGNRLRVRVRLERAVLAAGVTGRDVRERRHSRRDRSALRISRPLGGASTRVLSYKPEHRRREPPRSRGADLADVDGEDLPAILDTLDDLGLNREAADEPVEVRHDDDVRLTALDELDRPTEAGALREWRTTRHVELFERVDEMNPSRFATAAIRSLCSCGDTNRSPSRSPTRETRTTPTARRTEDRLPAEEGRPAPDFSLMSDEGETVTLASLRGSPVVLYFYPKDDTPGCTAQAQGIRDAWSEFEQAGAVVLGVSPDGEASHAKFKQKYDLPFTLLADTEHEVAEAYGVWVEKEYNGKRYMGVERSTFVIDADGNVAKELRRVKPLEHADQVLEALRG
jgi:peroxiredoxin Q/BCP